MGIKTRQLASEQSEENKLNIGLLGFKMAVNEGLTVFNLVDGVVDEFHDESGTDEAEGSNDLYCASNDNYINRTAPQAISAGFSISAVTEEDTSETGANPDQNVTTFGTFTVPTGMTSMTFKMWGAGGGTGADPNPSITFDNGKPISCSLCMPTSSTLPTTCTQPDNDRVGVKITVRFFSLIPQSLVILSIISCGGFLSTSRITTVEKNLSV